jgi:hypothetical protein
VGGHEVLDDLLLSIDRDGAVDEFAEIDVVALAGELQVDAVMDEPLRGEAAAEPEPGEGLDRALLTYSCERFSTTMESIPASRNAQARRRPAGPAPMMATRVFWGVTIVLATMAGGRTIVRGRRRANG